MNHGERSALSVTSQTTYL